MQQTRQLNKATTVEMKTLADAFVECTGFIDQNNVTLTKETAACRAPTPNADISVNTDMEVYSDGDTSQPATGYDGDTSEPATVTNTPKSAAKTSPLVRRHQRSNSPQRSMTGKQRKSYLKKHNISQPAKKPKRSKKETVTQPPTLEAEQAKRGRMDSEEPVENRGAKKKANAATKKAKKAENEQSTSAPPVAFEDDRSAGETDDESDKDDSETSSKLKTWKPSTLQAKHMNLHNAYVKANELDTYMQAVEKCGKGEGYFIEMIGPVYFCPTVVEELKEKALIVYETRMKSKEPYRAMSFAERPQKDNDSKRRKVANRETKAVCKTYSVPKKIGTLSFAMRELSYLLVNFIRKCFVGKSEILEVVNVISVKTVQYSRQFISSQPSPYKEILKICTEVFADEYNELEELHKKLVLAESVHKLYDNYQLRFRRKTKNKD